MATFEVPRMQALVGLSIMCFCTLAFHACSRSLYTSLSVPASPLPWPPSTQDLKLAPVQFKALMATLETLSSTISQVNSSLHSRMDHEFSLLQKVGTWGQRAPQTISSSDQIIIINSFIVMFWALGLIVTGHGMYNISQAFLWKVLLTAVWCANLGLLVMVFGTEGCRWYVFVLAAVWPAEVVIGIKIFFVGEKEFVRVEKVAEKRKEQGEKKSVQ
ncbi:hypothetical protein EG329_002840 [Mollisiaceae sp. DMI_Dod_QoI]|nr:hypothetical protein EG329_002840 [Helotiales sp. DMI_Dod_QoI]